MSTGVKTPDLGTVISSRGAKFRVARQYQDQFQGLVNALEDRGYTINPKTSGGYNDRVIAGTNTPSEHAYGRAIDVNWDENARGIRGKIPADVALQVAKQYGMTWGGTWRNPDDMHFEVAGLSRGGAVPSAVRQQVAPSPSPPPDAPSTGTGNFGVANTNLALSPDIQAQVSQPAPSVDPELLAALTNQGSLLGGGLSDIITKATTAANPTLQPRPIITDPTQASLVGQPLPLSRPLS
jgi:hypothetical protein